MEDKIPTAVKMVDQLSGWSDGKIMKHHGTFDPNLSTDLYRGTSHFLQALIFAISYDIYLYKMLR